MPPLFDTYEPDARLIHAKVAEAIDKAEGDAPAEAAGCRRARTARTARPRKPAKKPKQPQAPEPVTGGSVGSLAEGYAANESQDLDAAC